jgi:hypothetical protein
MARIIDKRPVEVESHSLSIERLSNFLEAQGPVVPAFTEGKLDGSFAVVTVSVGRRGSGHAADMSKTMRITHFRSRVF